MLIYGHRGAKGLAPENTLPSFRTCLELGVTRCELDVQLSRDEQLVVIHDPGLKRTTGRKGKVKNKTAAQLRSYDASHGHPSWTTPCHIPTLDELFACCDFEHWQIEFKNMSRTACVVAIEKLAQLAKKHELEERICITSSSFRILKAAREHAPHLGRGLVAEYRWLDPVKVAKRHECSLLALSWTLCTESRILKAKAAGLHVSVWTVNEPALMLRLADYGVDSLITDFPDLATATLESYQTAAQK